MPWQWTVSATRRGSGGPASGAGTHHGSRASPSAHGLQRQAQVGHVARQRALHRHHRHRDRPLLLGAGQVGRYAAERRPQPGDAGAVGRVAHRAGQVVAMGDGAHAGSHRGRGAAAGAAGCVPARPGVERAAVQVVLGEPAHRKRRRVGAADDHRTGLAQIGHHRAVLGGEVVLEGDHAVGGGAPLEVDVDLDRHRHAVQRAQRIATAACAIGGVGRGQRLVGQQVDDGVERRVDGLHALQAGLCGFAGGDGAAADGGGEALGGPGPQGVGHGRLFGKMRVGEG